MGITLSLVLVALGTAVVVSLPLGIIAALRQGSKTDKLITTVTQSFIAMPEYWLAPLLVLVFALKLSLLPSAGWNTASSIVLPAATLALRPISFFTSAVRSGMIDALEAEHIPAARARGLSHVADRPAARGAQRPGSVVHAVRRVVCRTPGRFGHCGGHLRDPGHGTAALRRRRQQRHPAWRKAAWWWWWHLAVAITTLADFLHRILSPKVSGALA